MPLAMYEEVIKKILESIDEKALAKLPKFSGEGYKPCKIDLRNFHQIRRAKNEGKIAFVDAGNAEIIGSANFSLSLIRVCCTLYQSNKKLGFKKFEILAFTQAVSQENEIWYKTSFFKTSNPMELQEISFNSFDHSLMMGINRADISSIASAIRRFAELELAKLIAKEKIADAMVLDGNLQGTLTNENKCLSELYEECEKNNVVLSALSLSLIHI